MRIPSGVTDQYIYFVAVDATDYVTRETGLSSFTVYRSRNGNAAAAYTTPTVNETDNTNMPGVYELLLDEDMTIDSGDDSQEIVVHITHTGMAPVTRSFELYRVKATAGETIGVSSGAVSNVTTTAAVTTVNGLAAGTITAAAVATDAIDADALAANAVTEIAAGITIPSAATIADAVWDEDATGHQTQGTFGQAIGDPVADTNTLFKAVVTDATGATVGVDVADVLVDTAEIGAAGAGLTAINLPNQTMDIVGNITGNLSGSVGSVGTGGITATSIATDAIDADALAASAVDEILDEVIAGSTTLRQLLRGFAAALLGKASGLGTTTAIYRDVADSMNVISATVDVDGNRTAVTLDLDDTP